MAIGDLRSKSQLLKPPIINVHAHSNACVHQIAKLKTTNYILWENYKIKFCQYKALYSIVYSMPDRTNSFHEFFDKHVHMYTCIQLYYLHYSTLYAHLTLPLLDSTEKTMAPVYSPLANGSIIIG